MITAPIAKMLRPGGPSKWTDRHQQIVQQVAEYLAQEAELALPNPEQPFILEVDAG